MLKITITGKRGEGKTLLAKTISTFLDSKDILSKHEYGVEDVIHVSNSNQMRNNCLPQGEQKELDPRNIC